MVKRELLDVEIIPPAEPYIGNLIEDIKTPFFFYEMNLQEILPRLQLNIENTGGKA